jgi:hypothetical protein
MVNIENVFKGGVRKTLLEWAEQQLSPSATVGVRLWLFGIFSSGPRADDMVNGFREMHARSPTPELYLTQNQKST